MILVCSSGELLSRAALITLNRWSLCVLVDRDRGGGRPPTPPTPPCVRVRTRRFETFGLTLLEQRRKTTIAEIGIRKRDVQSFRMGQMPRAAATRGGVIRQSAT